MSNRDNRGRGGFNEPFKRAFQGGSRDDGRIEKSIDDVWENYLANGYFDTEGNLRDELVRREKLQVLAKEMTFAKPRLSSNQLRRFFMHCRSVENRILAGSSTWERERTVFLQIDSAVADAFGKHEKKIPKIFHDFIQRNVATVRTKEDFLDGFLKHFEALVGFASQYLEKEKR